MFKLPKKKSSQLIFNSLIFHQFRRSVKTSTVDWNPIKTTKTPSDASNGSDNNWTKKILLGLMIAMPVVSFYLGTWQLRRLKWKTNLIATCEDRLIYPAIQLPKDFTPDMCEQWEYRKILVQGEFQHDEEIFVGPRVKNGVKGYLLFTPLVRKDTGERLLIERGWISEEKVIPEQRTLNHLSLPKGNNVVIECLVRVPKKRSNLQWDRIDKGSRLWQIIDIDEMCKQTHCSPIHLQAIFDLKDHHWEIDEPKDSINKKSWKFWCNTDSTEPKDSTPIELSDLDEFNQFQFVKAGVPIGKVPKIDLKNNHLQYLVTWYGLSFLSTIFLISALRRVRGSAVSQAQLKKDKINHSQKFM